MEPQINQSGKHMGFRLVHGGIDYLVGPRHDTNNDEYHSKQSLVADLKALDSDVGSNSKSEPNNGKQIIDAEPNSTVTTTMVHPNELEEHEEGECLFHL
jgi:hypothetical protein